MSSQSKIQSFLAGKRFAVVGASTDRSKYGNKVLRVYQQNKWTSYQSTPLPPRSKALLHTPISPRSGPFDGVSIITPPKVTERVVDEGLRLGIRHIWMQPVPKRICNPSGRGGRRQRNRHGRASSSHFATTTTISRPPQNLGFTASPPAESLTPATLHYVRTTPRPSHWACATRLSKSRFGA